VFGHIKHRHLGFAAEYYFQFVISINHTSVDFVLQFIRFDINPDFFHRFCTTTAANAALGVSGFINAALGLRFAAFFFAAFLGAAFFAAFFGAAFLGAAFLGAAFFTAFFAFFVAIFFDLDFNGCSVFTMTR